MESKKNFYGIHNVLQTYDTVVSNFGTFCLFYFIFIQSSHILQGSIWFASILSFNTTSDNLLYFCSIYITGCVFILQLYLLAEAFDTSYQNVLSLKHHLKQKLLTAKDKAERKQLKFLLNWMNDIFFKFAIIVYYNNV